MIPVEKLMVVNCEENMDSIAAHKSTYRAVGR